MSDSSTYTGPYARLREIISTERSRQYAIPRGDYSQGYIEALGRIENVIIEMERDGGDNRCRL